MCKEKGIDPRRLLWHASGLPEEHYLGAVRGAVEQITWCSD